MDENTTYLAAAQLASVLVQRPAPGEAAMPAHAQWAVNVFANVLREIDAAERDGRIPSRYSLRD